MVEAKIYSLAALLTLVLVLSSLYMNYYVSEIKQKELQEKYDSINKLLSSSQLEFEYLGNSNNSCDLLNESVNITRTNLIGINRKLEEYKEYMISDSEFNRLKTEQTILYVKIWMLSNQIKERCDMKFTTVLYLWDTDLESKQQGYILDAIREDHQDDLLVIPLDYNFNIGIINLIKKDHDVTSAPTIIINEQTKLVGLQNRETIEKLL
ncbi:MAG: hypothetical protein PHU12_00280 [Candidatus Aenigmarchaeota archaeon]|nr:hypothetical protein [Candidatus Aenigmarchaeota archaeon]